MGKVPNNRRLRTPNWTQPEKQYLLELIKARKEVVVPKTNNGPNYSEEKDTAWNEILRELSVKYGSKFQEITIKKVKTQWQNMKRIARDEVALNGELFQKYTPLSLEVCQILDVIKDGVLKIENQSLSETLTADVEIKTESIDEDLDQPSCSGTNINSSTFEVTDRNITNTSQFTSSIITSESGQDSANDTEMTLEEFRCSRDDTLEKKNASVMTEFDEYVDDLNDSVSFKMREFFKYTSTERDLKMESLKEERQVIRAMRETAELNKIIAEQKLKHVLWMKKREMAMYAGEPGSGAGAGGGGGGSIREAGGAFGKMQVAREEEYFYKKQKEQLVNLKGHLNKEISFHQEQIKRHEDAIRRHKEQMSDIDKHE